MSNELVIAYSATGISLSGRFIFMYLLYTKKSTNLYSLLFSIMNIVSSALWIKYSQMILDMPLLIRGSSDLLLFSISTVYIISNRIEMNKLSSNCNLHSDGNLHSDSILQLEHNLKLDHNLHSDGI
jgi:hypothetical protein